MSFILSRNLSLTELSIGTSSMQLLSNFWRILRIISTTSTSCFPCTHVFRSYPRECIKNIRENTEKKKINILIRTACDNFSNCLACNCWLNSVYLVWNQPEKLGDRKNRLYSPTQSPFIPVVNWGPELLKLARKSSGLNICGVGVA